METTNDLVLGGRLRMTQPKRGYRIAIDPILLAAAVPAAAGERVLDAGCGVGTAGLALARRVDAITITGLELQAVLADLARCNAEDNGLADSCSVITGDILDPPPGLGDPPFDHVMANPPFMKVGEATPSPDPVAATATVEGDATLLDWAAFAARMIKRGGCVTMIHRADRAAELAGALVGAGFGDLAIFPLWPDAASKDGDLARAARRVIVQGRLGAEGPSRRLDGLVLHDADGGFLAEAEAVLRHAAALPVA
ncbi:MAG: methyltransferase [Rhodospirillales bacterium]